MESKEPLVRHTHVVKVSSWHSETCRPVVGGRPQIYTCEKIGQFVCSVLEKNKRTPGNDMLTRADNTDEQIWNGMSFPTKILDIICGCESPNESTELEIQNNVSYDSVLNITQSGLIVLITLLQT